MSDFVLPILFNPDKCSVYSTISCCLQMSFYLVLVVSLVLGSIASGLKFDSPCPDLFHYDSTDQPNQWSGTVTLLSDDELRGVWIRLIFDEKLTELQLHVSLTRILEFAAQTPDFANTFLYETLVLLFATCNVV